VARIVEKIVTLPDGVWLATALLHHEQPDRSDFASSEIEARLDREGITGALTSASATISFDSVANKPANPGQTRMLYATDRGRRRLFRWGDEYHPSREGPPARHGTRWIPRREDIPERYHHLLDWYAARYAPTVVSTTVRTLYLVSEPSVAAIRPSIEVTCRSIRAASSSDVCMTGLLPSATMGLWSGIDNDARCTERSVAFPPFTCLG